jgi:alcohol dehydrogenase
MLALTFIDKLRLEKQYPLPARPPGEALLKVRMAGICATDLELSRGYMNFEGVLGHEFVAEVAEADEADLVGRRVVGDINCPCYICPTCAEGLTAHCPHRTVLGIFERDGAFAEYTLLPETNLHPIPEGLEDRVAVFAEPLAAALEILEQVPIDEETSACVMGDGKLGLLAAQVLGTTGCRLTVLGHHEDNLEILRASGIATSLAQEAPGVRYKLVVEATGSPKGLSKALDLVSPRGTVVLKTTVAEESTLPLSKAVINEVTIVGSRCGPIAKALEWLVEGKIEVESLIEATYPLSRGFEAFQRASQRGALKTLLQMESPS